MNGLTKVQPWILPLTGPVLCLMVMVAGVHGLRLFDLLPDPWPVLDNDRTILVHQARASREVNQVETVLLGDSSCLMNIDASLLEDSTGLRTRNLSTLSYVDPAVHPILLKHMLKGNDGQLKQVIVGFHPDALRLGESPVYYLEAVQHYLEGKDHQFSEGWEGGFNRIMGIEVVQGRWISRVLPIPLQGEFQTYYGFNRGLDHFMSIHQGSALDPGRLSEADLRGSSEYRVADRFPSVLAELALLIPDHVKLVVVIHPLPESFAPSDWEDKRNAMLQELAGKIEGRQVQLLDSLPATMAERFFASRTHLNAEGIKIWTALLGAKILTKR